MDALPMNWPLAARNGSPATSALTHSVNSSRTVIPGTATAVGTANWIRLIAEYRYSPGKSRTNNRLRHQQLLYGQILADNTDPQAVTALHERCSIARLNI